VDRQRERHSPWEEIDARHDDQPHDDGASDRRDPVRWRQLVRPPSFRRVLIGAPGSGKTILGRHTIATAARESAACLEQQSARLTDVIVPIWVTAGALALAAERDVDDPAAELCPRSRTAFPSKARACR
jgi:hypothetical protein